MVKKIFFFIILIFIPFCFINAQNLQFKQLTKQDGLSQSVIICSFQDSYGYLWFGTQNGLNRFDGYEFKSYFYDPYDSTSISNNWIFSIIEDENNNLWIGTKNGLNKFDRKTQTFEHFNLSGSKETDIDFIYGLTKSKNNNIIINSHRFLYVLNSENLEIEQIKKPFCEDFSVKDYTLPVFEDIDGNFWAATVKGIFFYNPKNKESKIFSLSNDNSDIIVYSIFEDELQNLWFGTSNGIHIYKRTEKTFSEIYPSDYLPILTDNIVYSVIKDKKNIYWLGTNSGLIKMKMKNLNKPELYLYSTENSSISHNLVYSVLIDKTENIWAGTLKELSTADLKPKKFKLYQKNKTVELYELLDNLIASIYKVNDSIIWVGNWGKGLNIINRNSGKIVYYSSQMSGKYYIPNDFIHCIFKNNLNDFCIGTRDGLFVFDKNSETFVRISAYYKNNSMSNLENHRIFNLIQDFENRYWIATDNDVYYLDDNMNFIEKLSAENSEKSITGNLIYDILVDAKHNIWIATSTGLNFYDRNKSKVYKITRNEADNNTLCDNFVVSLCEDETRNIWIGTQSGADYFNVKDSVFIHYSTHNGLPDKLIYEILKDKNNDIWFATGYGLARFDSQDQKFVNYSLFDGLQSVEFILNAVHQSSDGEIFFGGMNGFNSFYADSIYFNTYVPQLVFTDIAVLNKSGERKIPVFNGSEIELSREDYEYTIKFSALDYTFPPLNKYSYKMEGINDDWVDIGNRRFVTFSKLPPGKYTLRIKGSNNDGIWNEQGISLKIIIKPPFWVTIYAFILYAVLLILLVILIIKIREKALVREREILEKKVEERTEIINQQKSKIEKVHSEISASIDYAAKIQTALLPHKDSMSKIFREHFIFYLPKNVVSGDFFYVKDINEYKVFLVADCTGHGVPGAFLSMLRISLLNDIIPRREITTPSQILDTMRSQIKEVLQQKDYSVVTKDGLDMVLCIYNRKTNVIKYSGANIPLIVAKNKADFDKNIISDKIRLLEDNKINSEQVLIEYKPNKNPVGFLSKKFNLLILILTTLKMIFFYLFSDGFTDQFNDIKNQKMTTLRFKKMILNASKMSLENQKEYFENQFFKWKGNFFQFDDILLMAVKI